MLFFTLDAQPYFFKSFNIGVPATSRGWDLQSDLDGYTLATGSICAGNNSCFALIRLNLEGDEIWKKVFDVYPFKMRQGGGSCLIRSQDGNLLVAGDQAIGDDDHRIFLMKVNIETGDSLWTKFYNSPSSQFARSLHELENGDILIHGDGDEIPNQFNKTVVKTNSNGDLLWHKDYVDDFYSSIFGNMEVLETGELLMSYKTITSSIDPWITVTKLSDTGNVIWTKTYYEDRINLGVVRIRELKNGNYVLISSKKYNDFSTGIGPVAIPVTILDTAGVVLHENLIYHGDFGNYVSDIKVDDDGNIVGIGAFLNEEIGDWIPWIFKLNPQGEIIWERFFSNEDHAISQIFQFEALQFNPWGEIATALTYAGETPGNPFNKDVGFLLLNSEGCLYPNCDSNLQYVVTPIKDLLADELSVQVFPNPTSKTLFVTFQNTFDGTIRLVHSSGVVEKILTTRNDNQENISIDLSRLSNGHYFLQFFEKNELLYQKNIMVLK